MPRRTAGAHRRQEQSESEQVREPGYRLSEILVANFESAWRFGRRLGLSSAIAEEVAQEAFLVLAKRLDDVEPGLERAFLLGTISRLVANQRRSAKERSETPLQDECLAAQSGDHPAADELLERKQQRVVLDRILASMAPEFCEVLVLYEIEECAVEEIAAALRIPVGTAASRLRRAREDFALRVKRLKAQQAHGLEAP